MHRLLYSAAPLLAGSLAMAAPLDSPLTEYCDRSMVSAAAADGSSASDAPRCPFCRARHGAVHRGDGVPPHAPLWHRGMPVGAAYPRAIMAQADAQSMRGADGVKVCLTCHDGSLAGMLSSTAPDAEVASDGGHDKRGIGSLARP